MLHMLHDEWTMPLWLTLFMCMCHTLSRLCSCLCVTQAGRQSRDVRDVRDKTMAAMPTADTTYIVAIHLFSPISQMENREDKRTFAKNILFQKLTLYFIKCQALDHCCCILNLKLPGLLLYSQICDNNNNTCIENEG